MDEGGEGEQPLRRDAIHGLGSDRRPEHGANAIEQQQAAGKWFDRVEAVDREGKSREVWFDVTVMQAWLRDAG